MAFFNKLNTVARNAAKTAADMANDAIGTGRIAVKIKKEELVIEQQYEKIGEYFYRKRCEGMELPAMLEEYCVAIDIALATIKELEEERDELKDGFEVTFEADIPYVPEDKEELFCPQCGKIADRGALFCSSCGAKLPNN